MAVVGEKPKTFPSSAFRMLLGVTMLDMLQVSMLSLGRNWVLRRLRMLHVSMLVVMMTRNVLAYRKNWDRPTWIVLWQTRQLTMIVMVTFSSVLTSGLAADLDACVVVCAVV